MKLVDDWKKMWKSLAVILPTLAVLISVLLNALVDRGYIDGSIAELVRAALATDSFGLAVVVLVVGFVGRVIKQPKLKE